MESEYAGFDDTPEGEQPWQRRPVGDDLPTEGWPGRGELDKKDRGRYKVLRSQFLLQAMARHEICWFCKGAINYAEPYGSPWAAEVHHLDVVSANPDPKHYLDMTRWASSHALCNRRGSGGLADEAVDDVPDTGIASEAW